MGLSSGRLESSITRIIGRRISLSSRIWRKVILPKVTGKIPLLDYCDIGLFVLSKLVPKLHPSILLS